MNLANSPSFEGIARSSTPTNGSGGVFRSKRNQSRRAGGGGWNDVWDSSSDHEESVHAKPAHGRSTHDSPTVRPALPHASSTPIPVPSAKAPEPMGPQTDGKDGLPPARSSSYTHISAPSPSSYGPREEWTVLDTSEITEAEKVYEAGRNVRAQQAETTALPFDSTPSGSSAAPKPKAGPAGSATRSFGSGVAGLSKSFISIALGTSSGASSAPANGASSKGKGRDTAISSNQEGTDTSSRKRVYGRDAIRPDIDEILRGQSMTDIITHR
jgi:hypothetical protein